MKTAFVLGGGGLLGAHEVGMLRALSEAGVRPDLVVGTSVGAINGALVAADPQVPVVRGFIPNAGRPVTVYLPGHKPLGLQAPRTLAVRLAERGTSFAVADPGGRQILVAVQGAKGTIVVRTFVSNAELSKGVARSWLVLAALALILLAVGVVVANLLVGSVTRPISELARVSHRLAPGGLGARADPAGPAGCPELPESAPPPPGRT